MVLVPTWTPPPAGAQEDGDRVLPALVDALLCGERGLARAADVRDRTAAVSAVVAAAADAAAAAAPSAPPASESGFLSGVSASAAPSTHAADDDTTTLPTTTASSPPPPSKKVVRRAARAAEAAAAAVADVAAVVTAPVHTPAAPPPLVDEMRAAWKTAIVQAVAELGDAAAVDLNHVYAYVRFRARGDAKVHLTKARLRDVVRGVAGKRGTLVCLPRNRALRAASAKMVARCFKLAPGATAPPTDVALASLADALAAVKQGGRGGDGGSRATVEGAAAGVALASVRDMTVRGWRGRLRDADGG